jgi:hypothetical protein
VVRSVLRLVLLAATTAVVVVARPPAPQATLLAPDATGVASASHVVVHPAGPGAVRVSWSARSQRGVDAWLIRVVDSDDEQITAHELLALPTHRSLLVDGLPTGSTATATVGAFTGTDATGLAPTSSPTQVPRGLCARARRQCVSVDARRPLGPETHVAQGLLHGLDVSRVGAHYLRALDPRFWRISAGNQAETQQARKFTTDTTALLSDAWPAVGRDPQTGARMSPWQDWSAYRSFVADQVRARIADHDLPDYWEVQNEPDIASYYSPEAPPTAALVLQQFRVAYTVIQRVLPHAKVIGPSLSAYTLVGNPQRVGLADFIDFATRHRLHFAAISWHEVNAGNPSDAQRQLPELADRVQTVRTLLAASPVLRHTGIFVNEFDSAWISRQVGWDLGHVAALEQARVTQANRACFETCTGGADSLLDPNDGTTPRMTYWGRLAYAQMTGKRIGTTTSDRDTTAMASVGGQRLTVIVTRHNECALHMPSACPAARGVPIAGSGALVVPVQLPARVSGTVRVAVTQLSATPVDVPSAPMPTRMRYRVGPSHLLRMRLPDITNGAATVVRISWR